MIEDVMCDGIRAALAHHPGGPAHSNEIAAAIASSAVYGGESRSQLLSVSPSSDAIVQFDIAKAVLAAAGVLGAVIPLASGQVDMVSVLAALGALGALLGLTEPLPSTCAHLVLNLYQCKQMSRQELARAFSKEFGGPEDMASLEFERALERLEQAHSVQVAQDEIRLTERVIIGRKGMRRTPQPGRQQ